MRIAADVVADRDPPGPNRGARGTAAQRFIHPGDLKRIQVFQALAGRTRNAHRLLLIVFCKTDPGQRITARFGDRLADRAEQGGSSGDRTSA